MHRAVQPSAQRNANQIDPVLGELVAQGEVQIGEQREGKEADVSD